MCDFVSPERFHRAFHVVTIFILFLEQYNSVELPKEELQRKYKLLLLYARALKKMTENDIFVSIFVCITEMRQTILGISKA